MGFLDRFFRRRSASRGRSVGVRRAPTPARHTEQKTRQISVSPPPPVSAPPAAPPFQAPAPPSAPPRAPAPTVVVSRPSATPVPSAAAAPPPAPADQGKTEYVDVGSLGTSQVVGVLVAVEGELEGQVYKLQDGENRLGRSASCNVELPSKKISREHAKIIHQAGVFAIAPLSEQNPTLVNDEPTEGGELRDGDYVKVGRTVLRFRSIV